MIQIRFNSYSLCSETTKFRLNSSLTSKWFNSTLVFHFCGRDSIQFSSIQNSVIESESISELNQFAQVCLYAITILVPEYILLMRNDQMSGWNVGNKWKAFQNINSKLILRAQNYCLQWHIDRAKQVNMTQVIMTRRDS